MAAAAAIKNPDGNSHVLTLNEIPIVLCGEDRILKFNMVEKSSHASEFGEGQPNLGGQLHRVAVLSST
jgi:hypothetical protein